MASALIRDRGENQTQSKACEDRGRVCRDAAQVTGCLEPPEAGKTRKDPLRKTL